MTSITVGPFRKSSYSDAKGDCVEVAQTTDGGRAVRDTKNPDAGTQFHGAAAWSQFIASVKAKHLHR